MSPQEEVGTDVMEDCPSSPFCPGTKRLEVLFLVLVVTFKSSYPQYHNLFGVYQELDPSFDKTLAPAHESGEISACLKRLAALGQKNVWSAIARKKSPLCLCQAEGFPQPLCTHKYSCSLLYSQRHRKPWGGEVREPLCFALLP